MEKRSETHNSLGVRMVKEERDFHPWNKIKKGGSAFCFCFETVVTNQERLEHSQKARSICASLGAILDLSMAFNFWNAHFEVNEILVMAAPIVVTTFTMSKKGKMQPAPIESTRSSLYNFLL